MPLTAVGATANERKWYECYRSVLLKFAIFTVIFFSQRKIKKKKNKNCFDHVICII